MTLGRRAEWLNRKRMISHAGAQRSFELPIFIRGAYQQTGRVGDPIDSRFLPRVPTVGQSLIDKHHLEIVYIHGRLARNRLASRFVGEESEQQTEFSGRSNQVVFATQLREF